MILLILISTLGGSVFVPQKNVDHLTNRQPTVVAAVAAAPAPSEPQHTFPFSIEPFDNSATYASI